METNASIMQTMQTINLFLLFLLLLFFFGGGWY